MLEPFFKNYISRQSLIKYDDQVKKINNFEKKIQALTDDAMRQRVQEIKKHLKEGKSEDEIIHETFAIVREATLRVLKIRHFDVQLIGGLVLHEGKIAEMKTGEGKTIVALLPTFLNALYDKGVHVVTVNEYFSSPGRRRGRPGSPLFRFKRWVNPRKYDGRRTPA